MAIDPRNASQFIPQNQGKLDLNKFAQDKIAQVIRRKVLGQTNYQEPDDTCGCDDFITSPPPPPTKPRRRTPPLAPPPRAPGLPPPLPPPPRRYNAPQLPNVLPPFLAPPPIIFPDPGIGDGGGGTGGTGDTTPPPESTSTPPPVTSVPPDGGGPDGGLWEDRIACCAASESDGTQTDTQLSFEAEQSTHSGDFKNGCYPMCGLEKYREFLTSGKGFCDKESIQICKCMARNTPSNPCYKGNGQVSPPGANLTSTSMFKKEVLPAQYDSIAEYYADRLVSI